MHCIEFCVTSSTFTGSENCCVTSSAAADWHDATEAKGRGITSISRCFWHCEVVRKGHKCFPHVPHISDQLRPAFAWLVYHFLLYWQFQPNPLSPLLPGKSKRQEINLVSLALDASPNPLERILPREYCGVGVFPPTAYAC